MFPKVVLVVERLGTVVTLANITSVRFHMVQRHETSVELFVALVALEWFLTSVVSHMVVHDVSPVERLSAIRALELIFLHVCLDVPLQGFNLGELFLTKFTVTGLDEALFFLVDFLVLGQFRAVREFLSTLFAEVGWHTCVKSCVLCQRFRLGKRSLP